MKTLSRRQLILSSLRIPAGAAALSVLASCEGDGDSALVCADPKAMTTAEESVRRTLNYTEVSSDPAKVCAGCEFFKAGGGACGSCEMFSGKPVNPGGHCDSWSVDSQAVA